ncbi:hypothetical protein J4G37_38855, partial [Microvirga sp. 3-52]|nr:hypothetical protein [Microvirga sp. 3-52]
QVKGDGNGMTNFMHAIRLLKRGMKEEESRRIHSYENKERALAFRKAMLVEMQQELDALLKLDSVVIRNEGKVRGMDVRIYFLNGETEEVKIETYYSGENNQFLIIPVHGMPYTMNDVKEMIKIK